MNFWTHHGGWFLVALTLFPRLALLTIATPFGFAAWLAWLLVPSFLVAFLATSMYWHTNPALCVLAWVFAFTKSGSVTKGE